MRTVTTAAGARPGPDGAPAGPLGGLLDGPLGWDDVRPATEHAIAEWVESSRAGAPTASLAVLWDRIGQGLEGGKRLRPQLLALAYGAYGGRDESACALLGASVELLHGALVVHDDVIDRDFLRRGRPNVAGLYREDALGRGLPDDEARHLGASVAVIAGDLLLAGSLRLAQGASEDPELGARIADVVHAAVSDAAAGELDDVLMAHSTGNTLEDVLEMEQLKTAAYSFAAPLRLGAMLAGAPEPQCEDAARVGMLIGAAYQVIDDVLGTFGDERQTGKPVTSDLREGKLTVLTAYARNHPEVARHLAAGQGGTSGRAGNAAGAAGAHEEADGVDRVDRMREVLHDAGADEYALSLAHAMVTEALDEARRRELPPALRSELTRICNHVLHRDH
ncbi:polyprenyl synthetase family protein [Sinomonas halotolerans]|uniref:Polyprenyl synthetase family protein n=1 Tax=Sinomonas halotolerans TaxID=1644133 RepID=A0ABU9X2Q3_9MICC